MTPQLHLSTEVKNECSCTSNPLTCFQDADKNIVTILPFYTGNAVNICLRKMWYVPKNTEPHPIKVIIVTSPATSVISFK